MIRSIALWDIDETLKPPGCGRLCEIFHAGTLSLIFRGLDTSCRTTCKICLKVRN